MNRLKAQQENQPQRSVDNSQDIPLIIVRPYHRAMADQKAFDVEHWIKQHPSPRDAEVAHEA